MEEKKQVVDEGQEEEKQTEGTEPKKTEDPSAGHKKEKPEEKTFTQDEVNEFIRKRLDRERKSWETKKQEDMEEAEKLRSMDDSEKKDYRIKQLEKEIEAFKAADSKRSMTKEVRRSLSEKGITVSDDLAGLLVGKDAETTRDMIESFALTYQKDLEEGVRKALSGRTPKAGSHKSLSKSDILGVQDTAERRRLIAENLELFK